MDWLFRITMALGAIAVVFFLYMVYASATSEKLVLTKVEWACTATHKQMYMMPVGKIMVPQWRNVCDEYRRTK